MNWWTDKIKIVASLFYRRTWLERAAFALLIISLLTRSSLAQTPETWPTNAQWIKMINASWELITDPSGDYSQGSIDFVIDQNGVASYFWSSPTSLFFRMVLRQSPTGPGGLVQFAWFVAIDANLDGYLDWSILLGGISENIFTHPNTNGYPDNDPDSAPYLTLLTKNQNPLGTGFARIVANPTPAYPELCYLDFQLPYTALQKPGYDKNVYYNSYFRMFYATSTSEGTMIKDALGLSTTISGAFADATVYTPSTPGSYGRIWDTRDNAPYSTAGIWYRTETILVAGMNWPASTSIYYNSGIRNVRIFDSQMNAVWTGTVLTNADGTFTNRTTWVVPKSAAAGLYTISVEDPTSPGVWKLYDQFEIKAPNISITKTTATPLVNATDQLTYTITIQNTGNAAGVITSITDSLPAEFTYIAGSTSGLTTTNPAINGQQLTWNGLWTLAVGGTTTLTFRVTAGKTRGTFYNSATVDGNNFVAVSTGNTAPVTVKAPVIDITKSTSTPSVAPGGTVNYSIRLKNNGDAAAYLTSLADMLPLDFSYQHNSSSGLTTANPTISGQLLTWAGNWTIPVGDSVLLTFKATASLTNGQYFNSVYAYGSNFHSVARVSTAGVNVIAPEMSISKSTTTPTLNPLGTALYTIKISNTGTAPGYVTQIRDLLPTGFTYKASSTSGLTTTDPTLNGQQLTWSGSWTVGVGDSLTLNFQATASANRGLYYNNADISGSNFSPLATGSTAPIQVVAPVVTITKTVSANLIGPNDEVSYTITLRNSGDVAAVVTSLVDTLPSGFTYVNNSTSGLTTNNPTISGSSLTWNGSWVVTVSGQLTLTFRAKAGATLGQFYNKAAVFGSNFNPVSTNSTALVTVAAVEMAIAKTAMSDTLPPGGTAIYTIAISNTGSDPGNVTSIVDILPDGFSYSNGSTSGMTTADPIVNGQQLTWSGNWSVGAGASLNLTFQALAATARGRYFNQASLNGTNFPTINTGPTAPIDIVAPIITINKTANDDTVSSSANVIYSITIHNVGDAAGNVTQIIDYLPNGFSYVTGSSGGLTTVDPNITNQQLKWEGNWSVDPGSSITLNFSAKASLTRGTYYNNASVIGANFNLTNTGDTAPVVVTAPVLQLTKSVDRSNATPGTILTYTVNYSNVGDDNATFVFILENIPSNTTYVTNSATGAGMMIQFSHNNGMSYDTAQTAPVTNLMFQRTAPLPAGSSGSVSFQVRIN